MTERREVSTLVLHERLLSKAVINWETGCWEWNAARYRCGYGRVWNGVRYLAAHRVAYELLRAPIPEGLVIDHLCRVRHCINPAHLEPVTQRENIFRATGLRPPVRPVQTHCKHGHEFTPENTYTWRKRRYCRACRLEAQREKARLEKLAAQATADKQVGSVED